MALTRTLRVALVLATAASSCDAAFRIKHLGKGSSALQNVGIDSEPPTAGERGLPADDAGSDTFQKQAYDKRAASYDKSLKKYNYTVPDVIAHLCAQYGVPPSGRTLDFACGTGLVGDALVGAGFKALDGCDLSPASLEVIRTRKQGHYSDLKECSMNQFPYLYGDAEFDTIVFGGALNYAQSPYATLKELLRMTSPGGHIIYTYSYDSTVSNDLNAMRDAKERLEMEGAWAQVHAETPAPYRDDRPHRLMRAFVMKVTKNTVTGNGKGGVFVDTSEVLANATVSRLIVKASRETPHAVP